LPCGFFTDRKSAIRFILCFGLVSLFADMTYEGAHGSTGPPLFIWRERRRGRRHFRAREMPLVSLRFFRDARRPRAYWTLAIAGYNLKSSPSMLAFVTTWAAGGAAHHHRTYLARHADRRAICCCRRQTGKVGHGLGMHDDQQTRCPALLLMGILAAKYGHVGPCCMARDSSRAGAAIDPACARAAGGTAGGET
jgi:hypothetical protein